MSPNNTSTAPAGQIDISPPSCDLFSPGESGVPVVLLNQAASPARLLGFAHDRCTQLRTLASLAACSHEDEAELKRVLEHVWEGLDQVLAGLDCMASQLPAGKQVQR